MNKYDEMDLSGRADEELENDMRKILEEDTFNNYNQYNNYSSNNDKEEVVREEKGNGKVGSLFGKIVLYSGIIFLVIFILNFEEIFYEWNYDDNYEYEELYDIEYDLDENGYLDYKEQHIYELDKATDYEKNYMLKELFIDREHKRIYFELENNNSNNVQYARLNVAFYDENEKLIEVKEKYIDVIDKDKKVIEYVDYNKSFYKYDAVITVDTYLLEEKNSDNEVDVEIISNGFGIDESEILYILKNNSEEDVYGDIFVIFYDKNNNIIYIDVNYTYELKPGKTEKFEAYLDNDLVEKSSRYEIILSNIKTDEV